MKHIYTLLAALLFSTAAFAQLPDGSIAPDFTITDIDGVEHTLYDILDEGKKVIIDFSATWCGPCWNYFQSGTLEELNEMYGPDGTDEIRVFYVESDDSTTDEDLHGTGSNTYGDWTEGVTHPIIDDAAWLFNLYENTYYPTIYTICPNRILTESGQADVAGHTAVFQANDCAAATLANDPALLDYTGATVACPGEEVPLSVDLMNLGLDVLTACTITVLDGGNEVLSYDWMGEVETYGITNVDLGMASFDADAALELTITSADENAANNSASGALALAEEGMSLMLIEIMTDGWGGESGWTVKDAAGDVIDEVTAGSLANTTEYSWWVNVPSTGCYAFEITDEYGDGLYGSQWGSIDGYCMVSTMDDNMDTFSVVYDYDGSYDFDADGAGVSVTAVNVGVEENDFASTLSIFPNPFSGQTNLQFTMAEAGKANIIVYNLIGEQVINRDFGTLSAGVQREMLDFNGVDAGVYLVAIQAGNNSSMLRVTVQ